jgi:protein-disulfide isomerase
LQCKAFGAVLPAAPIGGASQHVQSSRGECVQVLSSRAGTIESFPRTQLDFVMSQHHSFELTVPVSSVDHRLGPDHAPVTLVEYGDFECPNCKQAAPAVKLLMERYAERVRLVFRHFPLEEVHPHARHAAEAAEAAGAQGKFWEMHDLLFDNQRHLKQQQLHDYAERLQLDMARYTAEMDDEIYLQRIREHQKSGHDSGARGTPTFFVNGRIQDVSFGMKALFDAVETALRR